MIQSYINSIINLNSNTDSVFFQRDCIRSRSCAPCDCQSWLCHNEGSANYDIVKGGQYKITFDASVSSATAGVVAFALFNNGEMIPGTLMIETLSTAGDYVNIGINKEIKVCCNGNANISVRSVGNVPTATTPTTPIDTQIPIIANANLTITRRS